MKTRLLLFYLFAHTYPCLGVSFPRAHPLLLFCVLALILPLPFLAHIPMLPYYVPYILAQRDTRRNAWGPRIIPVCLLLEYVPPGAVFLPSSTVGVRLNASSVALLSIRGCVAHAIKVCYPADHYLYFVFQGVALGHCFVLLSQPLVLTKPLA